MNRSTQLLGRDALDALRNLIPPALYAYLSAFAPTGAWLPPAVAGLLFFVGLPLAGIGWLFRAEGVSGFAGFLFFFAFLAMAFWLWSGSFGKLKRALTLYWRVGRKIPAEHAGTFAHLLSVWDEVCQRIGWAERREVTDMRDGKEVRRKEWVSPKVAAVDSNGPDLIITAALPVGSSPSAFSGAAEAWKAALGVQNVTISDAGGFGPAVLLCISFADRLAGTVEVGEDYSEVPVGPASVARIDNGSELAWDVRDAAHTIVQGQTRSGKSVGCYGLLAQVARMPDDKVQVWGVDPARGLLGPWRRRVHGRDRIVLGDDGDEAATLMDRMLDEMTARLALMEEKGVDKLDPDDPESPPLMLVVLEEWAGLIDAAQKQDAARKPADRRAPVLRSGMARLVREGAKVGVRVLLIVQRAETSVVDGSARGQFGMRITFAVEDADSVAMLHPAYPRDRLGDVLAFPPGRALVWHHRRENTAQFNYCDYQTYRRIVMNGGEPPMYESEDEPIIF